MTAEIRIGTAGWSYKDWHGAVYPADAGSRFDPLSYLKDYFDTIEVNSTFYRPARADMVASWLRRVEDNPRFMFTAKIWQHFTHDPRQLDERSVLEVRESFAPLLEAGRLGALLCQFPWSFKGNRESARYLNALFAAFEGFPLALEVRHASWNTPEVFEWLGRKNVTFCNIDQPLIGKSLEKTEEATTGVGYFRLHGQNVQAWFAEDSDVNERYNYLYDADELEPWAEAIERMAPELGRIYVIFNNHFSGKAAANALEMMHRLSGEAVAIPPALLQAFPRLSEIGKR